ncbi:MAG TPA: DmsE family decaheme c-type cytochrome [Gammaproteobacteria bacterium]
MSTTRVPVVGDRGSPRRQVLALAVMMCLASVAVGQVPPEAGNGVPYSQNGADTCLLCHGFLPAVVELFSTRHAVPTDPRGPFGEGQLQCEACHGPGGLHTGAVLPGGGRPPMIRFGADSVTPVSEQNATCLGCHESDTGFGWHGGAHDDNRVSCAGCHTLHAARDPVLGTATQSQVCYGCHQTQRAASVRPYAHPLREGKMSCTACHSPHGETAELQLVRQTVNETCYQCHAEKRGPFLWDHAPVAEDCALCHTPHGSNHPAMLTQRAPLLCQSCHSQVGHSRIAYDAGDLPAGAPSGFLLAQSCMNCHSQVHGSNHPSGAKLMR